MRVTQNLMSNRVLQNLNRNMEQMDKLNFQLSSGKQFSKPSDDPAGVVKVMKLGSAINALDHFNANSDQAEGLLNTTEGALADLTNIINRVRELAVQGTNGTLDNSERHAISIEIGQLREQVKSIANIDQGGKYIFAGTNFNVPPWDASKPPGSEWQGNDQSIKYQVGESSFVEVNVPGGSIFTQAPVGGQSLMAALDSLMTNLDSGNFSGIGQGITDMQANLENVIKIRADVGARSNRVDMTKNRLEDMTNNLQNLLSKAQDIDMAEVITQLKSQDSTYRAALASGAQIIQPSLLDFLK